VCTPVFWAHPVFSHICAMFRNIHCVEVINIYPMSITIYLIYYIAYYVMRERIIQTCSVFTSCKYYSYATRYRRGVYCDNITVAPYVRVYILYYNVI